MAQQRLWVWVALLVILLLKSKPTESNKQHIVGDDQGWTYGVNSWTNGRKFNHNDILVFNYEAGIHNVVRVSKDEYEKCQPNPNCKTHDSGHDKFKLKRGMNYFICGVPGHCKLAAMKIAIKAH